jgi:hypothetical protein
MERKKKKKKSLEFAASQLFELKETNGVFTPFFIYCSLRGKISVLKGLFYLPKTLA